MSNSEEFEWDVFICHATEDKDDFVRELAKRLKRSKLGVRKVRVWYDESALEAGDSLHDAISVGVKKSRYGIVVLSPNFFKKDWPQRELKALIQRDSRDFKVILPIWLNIDHEGIKEHSPLLADAYAIKTEDGMANVVRKLMRIIRKGIS